MNKICTKCQISKELTDFPKSARYKSGFNSQCKVCLRTHLKSLRNAKLSQYRKKAKERYWKDPIKARSERRNNTDPQKKSTYDVVYRQTNKKRIAKNKKDWEERHKHEPLFKIRRNLRRRIHHVLASGYKSKHTQELIGCTFSEFKDYIESKFTEGMTWENYGKWHLDHIKPCSDFDLTKVDEQMECFNYKNQQPLWAADNLKKEENGNKNNRKTKKV